MTEVKPKEKPHKKKKPEVKKAKTTKEKIKGERVTVDKKEVHKEKVVPKEQPEEKLVKLLLITFVHRVISEVSMYESLEFIEKNLVRREHKNNLIFNYIYS